MPSVNNLKPSENICALAVGNAGSGKTSAIASLASKDEPMYIFDIDHRIKGLLGSKEWLKDSLDYIDYDQYDTRDGFKEIEKTFVDFSNRYDKGQLKYKTLLIESVGSLSEMFLIDSQRYKGVKPGVDLSTLTSSQKSGLKITGNIAFPTPDDYHYGKRAFHSLFYNFLMYFTKCNVFLSAWTTDRWGKDPNNENPYAPDILLPGKQILATNKIANELPGYFDEIWQFEKEETGKLSDPVCYKVKFASLLAKTSIPQLAQAKIVDITGKNFKRELNRIIDPVGSVRQEISATKV